MRQLRRCNCKRQHTLSIQQSVGTSLCALGTMQDTSCPVEMGLESAGAGPMGRLGPAAQQAKPPFQDDDVAAGQYELSALMTHQLPSLQAHPGSCHTIIIAIEATLMVSEVLHNIWVYIGKVSLCPAKYEFARGYMPRGHRLGPYGSPAASVCCLLACSALACMRAGAGMQMCHGRRADCGDCISACEPRLPSAAGHCQRHLCRWWWRAAAAKP